MDGTGRLPAGSAESGSTQTYESRVVTKMFLAMFAAIEDENDRQFMMRTYLENRDLMFRVARKYCSSWHDAQDAVGTACLSLIDHLDRLKALEHDALKAYCAVTVKHCAISLLRKKREISLDELPDMAADEGDVDESVLTRCTIEDMTTALGRLEESDRVLLEMRYFLDMEEREMAKELGISIGALRTRLSRARRRANHEFLRLEDE